MVKLLIRNSTYSLVEEILTAVKPCIEVNLDKTNEICLIVEEIREFQIKNSECYIPIDDVELNNIYDFFIKPYLECEIYDIGSIVEVIRINKIIDEQIDIIENERNKLILKILKDVIPYKDTIAAKDIQCMGIRQSYT